MELTKEEYFDNVERLSQITGKRVGHHVYIHWDAVKRYMEGFNIELAHYINALTHKLKIDTPWNVVKFSTEDFTISLLNYPHFYKRFHPPLVHKYKIWLASLSTKSKYYDTDRPILHRCESMMIPNSGLQSIFCSQSQVEHMKGLYDDVTKMVTETPWRTLMKDKNLLIPALKLEEQLKNIIKQKPDFATFIIPDMI